MNCDFHKMGTKITKWYPNDVRVLHLTSSNIDHNYIDMIGGDLLNTNVDFVNMDILKRYDIIICSGGGSSRKNNLLGDMLNQYIQAGGLCIAMRASNQITKSINSYFICGTFPHAFTGVGPVKKTYMCLNNPHPIMRGVGPFTTDYAIHTTEVHKNAHVVAQWDDDYIMVATMPVMQGHVVSIAFGYFCTDVFQLQIVKNSIKYLMRQKWTPEKTYLFNRSFRLRVWAMMIISKIQKRRGYLWLPKCIIFEIIQYLC